MSQSEDAVADTKTKVSSESMSAENNDNISDEVQGCGNIETEVISEIEGHVIQNKALENMEVCETYAIDSQSLVEADTGAVEVQFSNGEINTKSSDGAVIGEIDSKSSAVREIETKSSAAVDEIDSKSSQVVGGIETESLMGGEIRSKSSVADGEIDAKSSQFVGEIETESPVIGDNAAEASDGDEESWDKLYDDEGEALDPKLMQEVCG